MTTLPGDNPSPTLDFVFRKLFGSEENKDLLISLINSIVEPDFHIIDIAIKNPFNLAAYLNAKESIVDIKAQDQDGLWYDLEIQVLGQFFYGKRATYYLSKLYVDQLSRGREFSKLRPAIGIHIVAFDIFNDQRLVRQFVFKDKETNEEHDEIAELRIYFVEMSKFNKEWSQVITPAERWIAFLKWGARIHRNNLPAALQSDTAIAGAVAALELMGADPAAREIYEAEEKARMIDAATLQYAQQRGEAIGKAQGEAIGEARGKREVILSLGRKRFGEPDVLSQSQLDGISSIERLNGLVLRIIEAQSWSDLLSQ